MIYIKSAREIDLIGKSGQIITDLFKDINGEMKEGVTTQELDEWIGKFIRKREAYSAFKGYRGYPGYSCISVNEEVVHGIPSDKSLRRGDIVSVDIGVELSGYIADAAKTFTVGDVSEENTRLLNVTFEALKLGIEQARIGKKIGDVSWAIQNCVEKNSCSVVKVLFGHGVGYFLHEDPIIPNFGRAHTGERIEEGMVFAIEPMVNSGGEEVKVIDNKWTVVTVDGKPSAHFEHTVAIVEGKPMVLTE